MWCVLCVVCVCVCVWGGGGGGGIETATLMWMDADSSFYGNNINGDNFVIIIITRIVHAHNQLSIFCGHTCTYMTTGV